MMHRPDSAARRGLVVPALWAAAIAARRAELAANGDASREQRRADEAALWLGDLRAGLARLAVVSGAAGFPGQNIVTTDGVPVDPVDALADVVAVAAAWYDAMVDPARQPAAIGG